MRFKAAFFLFIVLISLGSSWATQMNTNPVMDCCHEESSVKECSKPIQHEKRKCNKDHCNPFLSCSTTPVMISSILEIEAPQLNLRKVYHEADLERLSYFTAKHWQPPKI